MNKCVKYIIGTCATFTAASLFFVAGFNSFVNIPSDDHSHHDNDSYNPYVSVGCFYVGVAISFLSCGFCHCALNHDHYNPPTLLGAHIDDEANLA